jgi:NAD(P)-dependent dehydrogenase (short-subunit alcohol dehydrogenase family)
MPGKIIVTGASGAMGAAAVRALASQGKPVMMACRNLEKATRVRDEILASQRGADLEIRHLDLSSMDSVRAFAAGLEGERISALFNNAGVISRRYELTQDGLEHTFAVNYFGPVLLTRLLLSQMEPCAHLVNMVSLTCRFARLSVESLQPAPGDFSQLGTYACAKLALVHFSLELARRRSDLLLNLADPGIVNSNMISMGRWFDPLADVLFRPLCKTPEQGVRPALAALSSDTRLQYYIGKRTLALPGRYDDPILELRLWEETDRILFGEKN